MTNFKQFTVRVVLSASSLVFVLACANSNGGGGSPGAGKEIEAPIPGEAGEFKAQSDIENIPSGSCTRTFDSKLAAGQVYEVEERWMATNGRIGGSGDVREEILSVDPASRKMKKRTHLSVYNGWFDLECTMTDNQSSCDATDMSDSLRKEMEKSRGRGETFTQKSCYVKYDGDRKFESRSEEGAYTFKNGKMIKSFRMQSLTKGSITCGDHRSETVVGTGSIELVKIVSSEMPNRSLFACGAAVIYHFERALLDDGTVVNIFKEEVKGGQF